MNEQEAIKYMENEIRCIQRASYCDRDCAKCKLVKEEEPLLESYGVAIKALEKQIAKKPSFEGDGYYNGQIVYDTWICPCCDKHYEVEYEEYEHCPSCGQKIDWSD